MPRARHADGAPAGYVKWFSDLKLRTRTAAQRAALAVNKELLLPYWQIGRDILDRQAEAGWASKVLAWTDRDAIVQRFVGQLPREQNIALLTKLKTPEDRLCYAARAVEHGWSRPLLVHHIELRNLEREGKAIANSEQRLTKPQPDLARETQKDPYPSRSPSIRDWCSPSMPCS